MVQTWDLLNMKEWYFLVFVAYDDEAVFKISRLVIKVFGPDVRQGSFYLFFFSVLDDCYILLSCT